MNYAYYPGCSMSSSAGEYDLSMRLVLELFGCTVQEIPDWTCCGASAAEAVSALLALALPGRNLALAARHLPGADVLAPCSACYLNLLQTERKCQADQLLRERVDEALAVEELHLPQGQRVRHLVEVLRDDVTPERIAAAVVRPLEGLTLAPYYGCQILRPYHLFDDPEQPQSMRGILEALGATVLDWSHGARCCGASLMATKRDAALPSVRAILLAAGDADAVVTVCPLCHMNLEAYQGAALADSGRKEVSVLYLPQLMGLACGLAPNDLGLGSNLAAKRFMAKFAAGAQAHAEVAP